MAVAHDFWRRAVFDSLKSTQRVFSPFHFLLVVMISIFAAETVVMFSLVLLPPLSVPVEALLDATLLTVVILPALYFFLFRPLTLHITMRQQAEATAMESEERYRQLAENIREVFWISAADLRQIVYVSPEYEKVWGHACEQLYKEPTSFLDAIHPEDRDRVIAALPKQLYGEFVEEYRIVQPNGAVRWVRTRAFPVRNVLGEVYRIAGLAEDITDRKQAEHRLLIYQEQLQFLIAALSLTEERERRRLAMDLHDSIGQVLAFARLKLEALRGAASGAEHAAGLDDVGACINQAIQQARSLIFELSPPVLFQLGLAAAVESLAHHMQERHGLRIDVADDGQDKPLTDDMRILLFRAVQELLINVVKHAHARQVQISIGRAGDYIRITVVDDGVGFNPSASGFDAGQAHGFGLFSINERLHQMHGSCEVDSQPGQGTQVILRALLQREEATSGSEAYEHQDPAR
jgi:PAS domain S-box-containing protein